MGQRFAAMGAGAGPGRRRPGRDDPLVAVPEDGFRLFLGQAEFALGFADADALVGIDDAVLQGLADDLLEG